MPRETRRVVFSHAELHLAMSEYAHHLDKALPSGWMESLAFDPKRDPALVIMRRLESGSMQPATFRLPEVGAALLLFCTNHKIPLPKRGRKGLEKHEDTAAFTIVHQIRYATCTRVLILDALESGRHHLRKLLRQGQIADAVEAGSVEEALAILDKPEKRPDLVLCEAELGDRSGLDFARVLRAKEGHPARQIPILLFSADPKLPSSDLWRKAGVTAVLPKPIGPQALIDAVINTVHV